MKVYNYLPMAATWLEPLSTGNTLSVHVRNWVALSFFLRRFHFTTSLDETAIRKTPTTRNALIDGVIMENVRTIPAAFIR